jgi:hypothetical protein
LVAEETTEVLSAVGALLAIMPDAACTQKRTGLGPHLLPRLVPESSAVDSTIECVEASSGRIQSAIGISPIRKSGQV